MYVIHCKHNRTNTHINSGRNGNKTHVFTVTVYGQLTSRNSIRPQQCCGVALLWGEAIWMGGGRGRDKWRQSCSERNVKQIDLLSWIRDLTADCSQSLEAVADGMDVGHSHKHHLTVGIVFYTGTNETTLLNADGEVFLKTLWSLSQVLIKKDQLNNAHTCYSHSFSGQHGLRTFLLQSFHMSLLKQHIAKGQNCSGIKMSKNKKNLANK